ncbi:hypothetical protein PISMIDRAFT_686449 [Pisolithus microcarpus 441]|uniref:Uncharacterized protein n=1 Tax=Pisolithus microcarpus 441 TaxID=765257 RepID=A0A0C9YR11_9AGAM|nr:hypothetical protein PISMIDRAFT_686449 [Pisolithus microcarpus 441]
MPSDYDDPGTVYGHLHSSTPVLFVTQTSAIYPHVEQHRVSNETDVTIPDETAFYVLGLSLRALWPAENVESYVRDLLGMC